MHQPRARETEEQKEEKKTFYSPIREQILEHKRKELKRKMEEKVKALVRQRGAVKSKLTRISTALVDVVEGRQNPNLKNIPFLRQNSKNVDACYREYNTIQNEIVALPLSDDARTEQENRYIEFEHLYNEVSIKLETLLETAVKREQRLSLASANQLVPANAAAAVVQPPPLSVPLPSFDGNYENWKSFKCMFTTIMARYQTESPAIKLYHLKDCMKGKAMGFIDEETIKNNDYDAAWASLEERFEDNRLIIDKHIEALFNLPKITKESAEELRKLLDTCTKNVNALKNLDLPVVGLGEQMLLNVLSAKMDKDTRKTWETRQKAGQLPAYAATIAFLKERCKILEKIEVNTKSNSEATKPSRAVARSNTLVSTTEQKCAVCKSDHELWKCDQFKNYSAKEKYSVLRKSGSCYNCLQRGHRLSECSSSSCQKCGKRHHTLLHVGDKKPADPSSKNEEADLCRSKEPQVRTEQATGSSSTRSETTATLCAQVERSVNVTLLSTAVVLAYGSGGVSYPCRVLLDSASQTHFVTEQFAKLLALERQPASFLVCGLNGSDTRIRSKIEVRIKSRVNEFSLALETLIAPKITGELPSYSIDVRKWPLPPGTELADPAFFKRNKIDMLIGADVFWDLIKSEQIEMGPNLPTLRDTKLGWIVGGSVSSASPAKLRTLCTVTENDRLSDILKQFWTIEGSDELLAPGPGDTASNAECLEHFRRTHQRDGEGRYIVRLPFNERKNQLGDSKQMAMKRFLTVERRLDREPELKQQYAAFMQEYENLGHMREVRTEDADNGGPAYYLPHHCVIKPTSTTTKLRVVFDGSARTTSGVSLNDALMTGPTVQNDLMAILLNFRCYRFALTLDIPKMYRQVRINPDDARFQRVFWRDDKNQPLKIFDLLTVTYGLASSPFQATMTLNQLADDHGAEFPRAAAVLQSSCYIDDVLTGAQSLDDALQLQREIVGLLRCGGFAAHKWCSNAPSILEAIPEAQQGAKLNVAELDLNALVKTLGVAWQPASDTFSFDVVDFEPASNERLTRRKVASQVAKIFDPLGFIGPVLTAAKLILRGVGSLKTDWDELVPPNMGRQWQSFRRELPVLKKLRLPRWILYKEMQFVELHGYCDASDQAYGACIYTRLTRLDGSTVMKLVCSKSRLLPKATKKKKEISTPRGELLAALLLARLVTKVLSSTSTTFASVNLWSDSQIVLSWIRKPPQHLQLFVANRVAEIQRLTGAFRWGYICTDSNPADLISRGTTPNKLLKSPIWWDGPPAVPTTTDAGPMIPDERLPELKSAVALALTAVERLKAFDDVSDFFKLRRAMAYVARFAEFIISKRKKVTKGWLTGKEIKRAEGIIVKLVQAEAFHTEIAALLDDKRARHRLCGLNPFLDVDGLLRVGGRIKHAFIPYDSRHQMVLPAKHPVTELLIRHLHEENLHLGQRGLLAVVRQRFWPLNVKTTIRKVVRSCITCFRVNPTKTSQLMGDLPSYRVQPAPTFARTGIDFAGPFWIKSNAAVRKPTITKGYVCLFVCLCTRAIHLELVSNLSSDAFLAALRRMASRRGVPSTILSDNGTNLVGGNNELEELARLFQNELHQKNLDSFCSSKNIEWRFIPPRSPHFGGIWEAGVKSMKYHLKRIVGERRLTFEELYTTLTQIEAVLNSRPLTQSSDDPNDFTAITPAHFLIGRELQAIPEPSYLALKESTLSRWQLVQTLQQHFWKRWTKEYLPELQNRQKWYKKTTIKPGALVLIIDRNTPPMQWPLARIVALHPGKDNVTRVVTLRTPKGELKRAVHEICLLPLDQEVQPEERLEEQLAKN